jgi:hypothetical protein
MAINPQNVFAPYIEGPGLSITVSSAETIIAGVPTFFPLTFVTVLPNQTTYVYVDLIGGVVSANNSGFAASDIYPVAIVTSIRDGITTLVDKRPDIFFGGGGGGGTSADSVQILSTSQTVGFAGGTNTLIEGIGGFVGITLALPSAVGFAGRTMRIIKPDAGSGVVTVTGAAGGNYFLSNQYQYAQFESDNSVWLLLANN